MLVGSNGNQINPSLNQPRDFIDSIPPKEYEAMRDFLLGRALDWIKSNSAPFGVKELVGGPKGWEETPLQWLYDYFEESEKGKSCQNGLKGSQEAFNKAGMAAGVLLKDVLAALPPCTLRFVQEDKKHGDANSVQRNLYRLEIQVERTPNDESDAE